MSDPSPGTSPKNPRSRWEVLIAGAVITLFLVVLVMLVQSSGILRIIPNGTIPTETPVPTEPPPPTATATVVPTATITTTIEPTATATPVPVYGEVTVIGYSVLGEPLEVYRFGSGPRERMIVAGIHGGYEWNTVALADELIGYLMENPDLVPPEVTLYILRNLNPDGYNRSFDALGRANTNGVDLNRNFDANWQIDWNRDVCFNQVYVTGGPEPESEPEVKALVAFVKTHTLEALISYHSASLGIFPGGNPPGPKSQMLAYYLSGITPYEYPPKDIGCVYTGQLANWAVLQGIPAVDIELSTHGNTDFEINKGVLEFFLQTDLQLSPNQ